MPYWREMMAFWPFPVTHIDDVQLRLRIALFHDLVNRQLLEISPARRRRTAIKGDVSESLSQSALALMREPHEKDDRADGTDDRAHGQENAAPEYLSVANARDIINAASFFSQHQGHLFNVAFTLRPSYQARESERSAVQSIDKFRNELALYVHDLSEGRDEGFATITLFERDENGVFGLVVAHVPQLTRSSYERPNYAKALGAWCTRWCQSADIDDQHHIIVSIAPDNESQALNFHWKEVLNLCAGLDEAAEGEEPNSQSEKSLRQLLGIPKRTWRQPGPIRPPLLAFCKLLDAEATAQASKYRMARCRPSMHTRGVGFVRAGS